MTRIIFLMALVLFINTAIFSQGIFKATSGAVIMIQKDVTVSVKGSIVLDDKSRFQNEGSVNISATANSTSNFTDNTVTAYNFGTGKYVFSGGGAQTIKSVNQFERIEVANAGVDLASNIKSNTWYLKTGKVNTGSFIAIATSANVSAIQADVSNANFASSWVNRNLRRYITPATVNNYLFPVGSSARVNIAEMDNLKAIPLTGVTYVTVSFGPKPGTDAGLNVTESGAAYTSVNSGGVWYVTPNALPVTGKYDLKLFFNGFTGLTDNKFGILRRPDASSIASDWKIPANSVLPAINTSGRTVAGGFARRNNISIFNQFGIGVTAAIPAAQAGNYFNNTILKTGEKTKLDDLMTLNVYPNPVTGKTVFVYFNNLIVKDIKLFTIDGRQLACKYNITGKNQLAVSISSAIAKGTYVLQLISNDKPINTTIFIQ